MLREDEAASRAPVACALPEAPGAIEQEEASSGLQPGPAANRILGPQAPRTRPAPPAAPRSTESLSATRSHAHTHRHRRAARAHTHSVSAGAHPHGARALAARMQGSGGGRGRKELTGGGPTDPLSWGGRGAEHREPEAGAEGDAEETLGKEDNGWDLKGWRGRADDSRGGTPPTPWLRVAGDPWIGPVDQGA